MDKKDKASNSGLPSPKKDFNADIQITPGLVGLNLSILHALDMHMIEDAKNNILKLIQREHAVVANVQKNMVALLKTKIPKERYEARHELEQIVKSSPNHLNTLADLEHIYRELHRITDADRCRRIIDKILASDREEDIQNKRICLLEQGYAILIERTLINENTVELRISDLHKILTTEHEKSDGKRRECLERGLHHQTQVLRNIQNANEDDTVDGHLVRKGSSLQKFEMAGQMCSKPFPHTVWNFYFAKALNQYYDSLESLSRFKDKMEDEMRQVTFRAVEKFWKITQEVIDEDIKTFIARSYAYIGQILIKRDYLFRSKVNQFELIRNQEFRHYTENPLDASRKAYYLKSNDITVLNRYGRSLWNRSSQMQSNRQKLQYLNKADEILTASIRRDSDRNWFAYSTRMIVRRDIADAKPGDPVAEEYLESARKDGHICFKSKSTRRDMSVVADVCQQLAKFPHTHKYGVEFVHNRKYLHQALDYLFYATHLGDPPDFHWTNRTASCLFDLGEYEQAVEWQRKCWFHFSPSSSYGFYITSLFMLTMFDKRNLWQKSSEHLFREFLYILVYAKAKYKDISRNIEGLYKTKRNEMLKFMTEVLIIRPLPLRAEQKDVLNYCLDIFIERSNRERYTHFNSEFRHLKATLKDIEPENEGEYVLSEIFKNPSLKPLAKGIKPWSKDFKYDFFISHSHRDGNWVDNILLRHLECKFDENDVAFKGCIADRDFTPGVSVLDNIVEAINRSYKVILILTERFVSSNWCQYEADQAIIRSLNSKNDNCVIPVLLEECDIPDKIAHLNYANLTVDKDFSSEMRRLKMALLPGDK